MRLPPVHAALAAFTLLAISLAGCAGQAPAKSWPGLAVGDDTAYVAFQNHVYAVNLADGKLAWQYPQEADRNLEFYADPVISGDVLVAGTYHSSAVAIQIESREVEWTLTEPNDVIIAPAAVADGVAFVPSADYHLYATDLATGEVRWSFAADQGLWAKPLLDGDTVYVASLDHRLYALDAANGIERWSVDLGGALAGTPAIADGMLFVGILDKAFYALDAASGDVLWSTEPEGWVWGGPQVADGTVYFGDLEGNLYALNAADGSERWTRTLGDPIRATPALADGQLIVGTQGGALLAISAKDGSDVWTQSLEAGQLLGEPVVAGDLILVAPHLGPNLLEARRLNDGGIKWAFSPTT